MGIIEAFRRDDSVSQVFMTTHSPIAVESCDASELAVVVPGVDGPSLQFLPEELQSLHRTNPSACLARKIVVTEGSTEEGLVRAAVRHHDNLRRERRTPTSAAYEVSVCNGGGGAHACEKAGSFLALGYGVLLMIDGDDKTIDSKVSELKRKGLRIFRWGEGACTESAIISGLTRGEVLGLLM